MKTIFAVHHVFDCLDYNEHHYFTTFAEAFDMLSEIKNAIQEHKFVEYTYEDHPMDYSVHLDDGLERVYIEEIYI